MVWSGFAAQTGFTLRRLWPSYDTLQVLSSMGRYPIPIRMAIRAIDATHSALPILAPRKWLYWIANEKRLDTIHRAGSLCFVMEKEVTR